MTQIRGKKDPISCVFASCDLAAMYHAHRFSLITLLIQINHMLLIGKEGSLLCGLLRSGQSDENNGAS